MAERWVFEQDDERKWTWRRSEPEEQIESADSFKECIDCMLDAVRHAVQRRRAASGESGSD